MMTIKPSSFKRFLAVLGLLVSIGLLAGCSGDDGATGPQGPQGVQGPQGEQGPPGQDLTAVLEPESCSVCHSGAGDDHQAIYTDYMDESQLDMEIVSVKSVAAGGAFNVTMTVKIMKDGLPYVDADDLRGLDQKRFYIQGYDAATRSFPQAMNESLGNSVAVTGQPGVYQVSATGVSYAPENSDAFGYGYIAQGLLDTEPAGHVSLYEDVSNAGLAFGDVDEYSTYANVSACESCHGSPYMKHGYRAAQVPGLPDFAACKVCHYDDRTGGHPDWQQIVDDPVAWGNGEDPGDVPQYAYKARIMNDVHMSHAMEFPYPQSMANCTTCHEGKMDMVAADEFFTAETCKSCHGIQSRPEEYDSLTFYEKKAPSLETIWEEEGVGFHNIDLNCGDCHDGEDIAAFHNNGYNPEIYDSDGNRWADLYTAEITSLSMADGVLDIRFTGNTDLMTSPQALVSFYGYDTKNMIVASHTRNADRQNLEKTIGTDNVYIAEADDSTQGNWHLTFPIAGYDLADLQGMIDDGVIKKLEVSIRPTVRGADDEVLATNAVSKTLDLASNATVDDYYKGDNAIVLASKCDVCHDALATTFHSGDRGGDITVCKHCHYPGNGGSHLEMQTREISGYVHAIHSFQAFDTDEINFDDNVEAAIYNLHIEHTFPNFTIKNCKACHTDGVFNVPDQSESLPAVLSASYQNDTWDRNIGDVPSYVVGPATKACGACHRADLINEDAAGELTSFYQHTKNGGYLVEEEEMPWEDVVSEIMALFE